MNLQENIQRIKEVMGINESIIPMSIIRRANEDTLKEYITKGEINYPTLCDDFEDEYDYADAVIDYALDEFINNINDEMYDEDYYSDVMDYLRNLCRNLFGQYLIDIYVTTCSEYNNLDESFEPVEYLKYIIDKNKPVNKRSKPGADSYERYKWINAFQKYVDLIYKYTRKEINIEGLEGITVLTVWADAWGTNFNNPKNAGMRTDWTVRLAPKLTNEPIKSKHKFDIEYKEFQEKFKDIARMTGLDITAPMDRKGVKENKVKFDFLELSGRNFQDEMEDSDMRQEQNESEITEKCWRGYTQKGMKTMFGKRYPNCVKKKNK